MSTLGQKVDGFFSRLEYRWSLGNLIFGAYLVTATALPAWAVSAMRELQQFAPLSWVVAGFVGLVIAVLAFAVFSGAYRRFIQSRYDRSLYERSGFVDPMAKTFEDRRIFLSDFCLPSDAHIDGKVFSNCEIIGPANMFLRMGNHVVGQKLPFCDGVLIDGLRLPYNTVVIDNCTFRDCSFKRITIFLHQAEFPSFSHLEWLKWISATPPNSQAMLPGLEPTPDQITSPTVPQPPEGTATETQP